MTAALGRGIYQEVGGSKAATSVHIQEQHQWQELEKAEEPIITLGCSIN